MVKYSTYTWDLVWALNQHPSCKTAVTLIDSIRPNNQEKGKNLKLRFNSQETVWKCLGLSMYTEPRAKRSTAISTRIKSGITINVDESVKI